MKASVRVGRLRLAARVAARDSGRVRVAASGVAASCEWDARARTCAQAVLAACTPPLSESPVLMRLASL